MHIITSKVCTYTIHDNVWTRSGPFSDIKEIEQIISDMGGTKIQYLSIDLKEQAIDEDAKPKQNDFESLVTLQSEQKEVLKEETIQTLNLVVCDKLLYPSDVKHIIKEQYNLNFDISKYDAKVPVRYFSVNERRQPGLRIGNRPTTQTFYDVLFEQVQPTDVVVDRNLNYLYGKKCDVRKVLTEMLARTKTKGS